MLTFYRSSTKTTKIWLEVWPDSSTRRMEATFFPSGEKTQASDRGAVASSVRDVRRLVFPVATSVMQTLLSMTCATCRPSGLQVNEEAMLHSFRVTCSGKPPLGDTIHNCTIPESSFIRNAMREPSGELRSQ